VKEKAKENIKFTTLAYGKECKRKEKAQENNKFTILG
jgi:hypothetical protein